MSNGLQALQLSAGLDQQHLMVVLSVVDAVGLGGLQINEPGTQAAASILCLAPPGAT